MSRIYDIIIVGGGVMGVSIAWALTRQRAGRVAVLEKSFLGAGSSGKSGAIIRQHYSNRLTAAMARKSLHTFEHFEDIVAGPPVFTRTGMVIVVNEKDRAGLNSNLQLQQSLGIDVRLVSGKELTAIDPNAKLAEDELAAFESEAGYVEAVQVVASYADAARRKGAEICQEVEVKRIITRDSHIDGVETSDGIYQSRTVILAAGPWAASLAQTIGLELPVQACRTQV